MRPRGRRFEGSNSLFRTLQDLVKCAGHAVWFTEFTHAKLDHLGFVNRLLHYFCELDTCCALVNAYPAYIAGALSVYSTGGLRLSLLYIVRTDSPILENIYNKVPSFHMVSFTFAQCDSEENAINPDYYVFAITLGEETVEFLIGVVDVTDTCGSKCSINLLEFLLDTTLIFAFTNYGIVCVPLDSPKRHLRHRGTASEGWTQNSLCRPCFGNYRPKVDPFLPECTDSSSCRCHVCSDISRLCEV